MNARSHGAATGRDQESTMARALSDVLIVGGGPAGLSAALALGRALKRVTLCDAGTRRNAPAEHMHGFVTRDGIAPTEFRRVAREQLRPYGVRFEESAVARVERRASDRLSVTFADGAVRDYRRVLLTTGMVDELPAIPGARALWGSALFACPYCHGFEARHGRWGLLASGDDLLERALFLRGWTDDLVVFTHGTFEPSTALRTELARAGIGLVTQPIRRLVEAAERQLAGVALADGSVVARDALVVRAPQRQTPLVAELGLALDGLGFVMVNEQGETSLPGVLAAGDLTTPMQAATLAAAAGTRVAYAVNHALNLERARGASRNVQREE